MILSVCGVIFVALPITIIGSHFSTEYEAWVAQDIEVKLYTHIEMRCYESKTLLFVIRLEKTQYAIERDCQIWYRWYQENASEITI